MHDRHERIRDLFVGAVEMPPVRRGAFLDEACGEDADLRAEVQKLLAADEEESNSGWSVPTASLVPRFPSGKILSGRFRVAHFIAAGGMGDVYEVEDLELGERIALKTIRPDVVGNPRHLTRFKREIQYAKRVTHPNVCRIHDLGSHKEGEVEVVFLTMELLTGETLASRLRSSGRMNTGEVLPLAIQMAEALSAAHDAGIIHRDFKTSNVMLVAGGAARKAVVTDFGVAYSSSPAGDPTLTESGKVVGTPVYMAPEQLTHGELTPATDVYALGLVMYEMVTGQRPFRGDTPFDSALKRLREPPPSPSVYVPDLDRRWEQVILRCLEREPSRRFQTPREVVQALTETAGWAPTETLTRERHFPFSRRVWIAISAAAFVLVAAGFLGWRWLAPASGPPTGEALRWYQEGINALRDGTYFKASKALERAVELAPHYALAHARLAEAWMELDYTDKARDEMLKANPPGVRSRLPGTEELHLEAIHLTLTNDLAGAIAKYQEILKQASGSDLPDAYLDLGRAYQRNEKPQEAIQSYGETIRRSPQYAAAFLRLGTLYARAKNAGKADEAFNQAESLYRSLSNIEGLAEVLYQRATAAESSHPKEAAALAEQTIATAKTAGSMSQQILGLLRLSSIEYKLGDSAKAQRCARDALELSRDKGLYDLTPRALIQIGNASFTRGELGPAMESYQQALDHAHRYAIRRQEMNARFSLASVLVQQGKVDEGVRQLEPALNFFEQGGYRREASQALLIITRAKRKQGDYAGALKAAEQQLQVARQMDDQSVLMLAEGSIGDILGDLGRFPEALAHYQEYYAISKKMDAKSGMAYALVNVGATLGLLGRDAEARDDLQQVLTSASDDQSLRGEAHLKLANIALADRRLVEAKTEAERALGNPESRDAATGAEAYRVLGLCAALAGHRAEAIKNAGQASDLTEKSGSTSELGETLLASAEVRLDTGDAAGAADPAARAHQMFSRTGQLESEWRAWLVIARVAAAAHNSAGVKEAVSQASIDLAKLSQLWGDEPFQTYVARPDIQQQRKTLNRLSQEK